MNVRALFFLLGSVLSLMISPAVAAEPPHFLHANPGFAWEFPRDHWAHHDYKSEWWYFTGHLESVKEPHRRFGYQVTFFRVGLARDLPTGASRWRTRSLVMGHLALSDLDAKSHRFSEVLRRASPLLGGFSPPQAGPLAWVQAPAGTDGRWSLSWVDQGFEFETQDRYQGFGLKLRAASGEPRIFQGPGGLSRKSKSEGAASLYYSYPRLKTTGTVVVDGTEIAVQGESWMDKEFGSSKLATDQVGWDWFSLQLADGRELMIYVLRKADGGVSHAQGTLVAADGTVRYLGPEAWSLKSTGTWSSPANEAVYPSGWRLKLPAEGLDLTITPAFPDQENRSTLIAAMAYWEGVVSVTDAQGKAAGQGFVELTGYGKTRRPTPEG